MLTSDFRFPLDAGFFYIIRAILPLSPSQMTMFIDANDLSAISGADGCGLISAKEERKMSASQYTPIPQPPGVPLLGNVYNIDPELPLQSLELLADNYGMKGPAY